MKLFFFDTETTGLDPKCDYIVQFWWIFWDYNLETWKFREEEVVNWYINVPKEIPSFVSNIHHIYNRDLVNYDYFDGYAERLLSYFQKADCAIAHNVDFDKDMVIYEFKRIGISFDENIVKWIDTMKPMTQFVRARKSNWALKYPKLTELYYYLFWKTFNWAHDALNDLRATMECFFYILKNFNVFTLWKEKSRYDWWFKNEEEKNQFLKNRNEIIEKLRIQFEDPAFRTSGVEKVNDKVEEEVHNSEIAKEIKEYVSLWGGLLYYWDIIDWKPEWKGEVYDANSLIYEWEFKNWLYNWLWRTYYKWKIEYEWEFKWWLFNWKWKLYYDNTIDYEWDFADWDYEWFWRQYYINWKLQYKWTFKWWRYNWDGILYNDDGTVKYKWNFIYWYPEKIFYEKLKKLKKSKKVVKYQADEENDDVYNDEMHEYEDDMAYKEYEEAINLQNQGIKESKYERVMVHKTKDEELNDDEDDFYNQMYDEDDDVEYIPHKS